MAARVNLLIMRHNVNVQVFTVDNLVKHVNKRIKIISYLLLYSKKLILLDSDPCASRPCLNNGNCQPNAILGTYQCNCQPGYTGLNCSTRNCFNYNCSLIYKLSL